MLQKLQKRKNEGGFTIIEVLIVLAIAGLIMLVVFLAVPALQRNSRNNQYRAEAQRLLSAYAEAVSNNAGSNLTASTSPAGDAGTVLTAANAKNIQTFEIANSSTSGTVPTDTNRALLRMGAKCNTNPTNPVTPVGSARQVAILFRVETSGSTIIQCLDS